MNQFFKNEKEIFPLGSVVMLKGADRKVMIAGRLQKESGSGAVYDYSGVLWPEGLISSREMYLFNHEDIDQIWHIGMQNDEEFSFRHFLDEQKSKLYASD